MQRAKAWKWAALSTLCLISSAPAGAYSAPAPAPAAKPAPGGLGASNAPVDISSDQSDIYTVDGVKHQVYKGNVDVIQGTARLRTPQLTVFFSKAADAAAPKANAKAPAPGDATASFGKIERMEAEGPVYYTTPTQNAKGDHGTYVAADDTITMIGNVVLLQDKNVGTGDKLVIEQKTGHSTLYSGNSSKRVRGVFYQQPATPAAGAAPTAGAPAPPSKPPARP